MMNLLLYITILLFHQVYTYLDELVLLDDDSFEHLTQAASGSTTGYWLVFMIPQGDACINCKEIEKVLEEVGGDESFQGRINFAKLDSKESRLTLRRFKITKPTIMFFRLGYQWKYNGQITVRAISHFLSEGHANAPRKPASKPLDRFDVWQEDFMKELKVSYKEKRLPEKNVLFVLLGGMITILLIISCMIPKRDVAIDDRKKENKKKR